MRHTPALIEIDVRVRRNDSWGVHSPLDVGHCLKGFHLMVHGLIRNRLQTGVDGGVDHQPVGVNVMIVTVGPIDQPFANLGGKMRRGTDGVGLAFEFQTYRAGL